LTADSIEKDKPLRSTAFFDELGMAVCFVKTMLLSDVVKANCRGWKTGMPLPSPDDHV